eukprot:4563355-Prymnesium_polylepis.2
MASKGGGLQILESTLAAHSSRISGCRSTEWEAGGLNADSNAVVTFLNSKLNGCYARTLCGGVYIKGASLTMVNSTVQHCLAESAAGLRLFQSHVVIEFSVFEECHAAFRPGWDSTGGAVDSSGVNTCIFRNAIIRNCSSAGGAINVYGHDDIDSSDSKRCRLCEHCACGDRSCSPMML